MGAREQVRTTEPTTERGASQPPRSSCADHLAPSYGGTPTTPRDSGHNLFTKLTPHRARQPGAGTTEARHATTLPEPTTTGHHPHLPTRGGPAPPRTPELPTAYPRPPEPIQ